MNTTKLAVLNENNQVHEGQTLIYELDYCKHLDVPATVSYQLVDGMVIGLPGVRTYFPLGCKKVSSSSVTIPKGLHSHTSKYKLVLNLEYRIHPLRSVSYTFETEEFTILPSN